MNNPALTQDGEQDSPLQRLLKLEEAADLLQRSHWTMRKYVAEGRIRGIRIGRDLMIEPSELRRFIEEARD